MSARIDGRLPARWISWLILGLIVWGSSIGVAWAHGEAELTVTPTVANPGSMITVAAEEVEAGEIFIITLEAPTFTVTLGSATVEAESFSQEFVLPDHVPPGIYRVRATTAEGETITAELTIEAGSTSDASVPARPSDELMNLDRTKTGAQVAGVVIGLLASVGLGLVLVRGRD